MQEVTLIWESGIFWCKWKCPWHTIQSGLQCYIQRQNHLTTPLCTPKDQIHTFCHSIALGAHLECDVLPYILCSLKSRALSITLQVLYVMCSQSIMKFLRCNSPLKCSSNATLYTTWTQSIGVIFKRNVPKFSSLTYAQKLPFPPIEDRIVRFKFLFNNTCTSSSHKGDLFILDSSLDMWHVNRVVPF